MNAAGVFHDYVPPQWIFIVDFEAFESDEELVDAVIHNLTVIGEAANRIPPDFAGRHTEIPQRRMIDLRNLYSVSHG